MRPNSIEDLRATADEYRLIKENALNIAKHCDATIVFANRIIEREEKDLSLANDVNLHKDALWGAIVQYLCRKRSMPYVENAFVRLFEDAVTHVEKNMHIPLDLNAAEKLRTADGLFKKLGKITKKILSKR